MNSTLNFAGDINIEDISIISSSGVTYPLINQLLSIQIFEDLYSPFITGSLILKDSLDFINLTPIIGQELLNVKLSTPGIEDTGVGRLEQQFFIYRIKDREVMGDRSITYTLDFISKEAVMNTNTKLSKGYKGNISDIVSQIVLDDRVQFNLEKDFYIEPTNNKTQYVSNYWSPVKNLNYLASMALNKNDSPSFIFYECRSGFKFLSLDSLCEEPEIIQDFIFADQTQVVDVGSSHTDIELNYSKIESIRFVEGINTLERMKEGMLASVMLTNDIVSKRFSSNYFNYQLGFFKKDQSGNIKPHLNKYPLITDRSPIDPLSLLISSSKSAYTFNDFYDSTNSNYLQQRLYELREKSDFSLQLDIIGRFSYIVGQVVHLDLGLNIPVYNTSDNIDDNIYSGNYLITAINHFITRERHKCTIEISKDSYSLDYQNLLT